MIETLARRATATPVVAVVYGGSDPTRAAAARAVESLRLDAAVAPVDAAWADPFLDIDDAHGPLVAREPVLVVAVGRLDAAATAIGVRAGAPVVAIDAATTDVSYAQLHERARNATAVAVLDVIADGDRRFTTRTVTVDAPSPITARCRSAGHDQIVTSQRFALEPCGAHGALTVDADPHPLSVDQLAVRTSPDVLHVEIDGRSRRANEVRITLVTGGLRVAALD